jgi:AcrR family transcriptional regulator
VTEKPRRTQRERVDESSRRLIDAAITLIGRQGYAATTAQQIGLHAGYSRDMVRVRFGNKEALLDAILTTRYEGRLDTPDDPDESGLERVLRRIANLRAFAGDDPDLLRAMLVLNFEASQADTQLRSRIRTWIDHVRDALADAIRTGQRDGSVTGDLDAGTEALEMVSAIIGFAYWWIVEPGFDLPGRLADWSDRVRARLSS